MARIADLLAAELAGRGRCLEIGVGTGRVALPLHQRGVPLAGIDLSAAMMAVLVEKAGGRAPFPLARADATRLPFPDAAFGAGLASHVFHLIPRWREAVDELVRVVRPGGVVLIDAVSHRGRSIRLAVQEHIRRETGAEAAHPGPGHPTLEVERALVSLGAGERVLPAVKARRTTTVGTLIDDVERGCSSWTWSVPEAVLQEAAARTRTWAVQEFGPLDAPTVIENEIVWHAFDLP
jgi:ubiquinone/menaquinone biosynthesis C-methylase UbiE